jgi:hypothetical protein
MHGGRDLKLHANIAMQIWDAIRGLLDHFPEVTSGFTKRREFLDWLRNGSFSRRTLLHAVIN